jgi:hypothetical protein
MLTRRNSASFPVALILTSAMLLAGSASGQTGQTDVESDVAALKADNAAVREQLRKMEEQQKALLELVERLQRRLEGTEAAPRRQPPRRRRRPRGARLRRRRRRRQRPRLRRRSASGSWIVTRTGSSSRTTPTTPRCLSC